MGYMVAIESDAKTVKDIVESWTPIARGLKHKVITLASLAALNEEMQKPESTGQVVSLLMIPAEILTAQPVEFINNLKTTYNCEILVSLFDSPKFAKSNTDQWSAQNFLFKPFDLTILKEHTRFALMRNQRVKTEFVHTTTAKAEIESLKKFKSLQLTEFGFRLTKAHPLILGEVYKFYHPLFINQRQQHVWARVISTEGPHYDLLFCQVNATTLSQVRKKINSAPNKVRGALWPGRATAATTQINVFVSFIDESMAPMVIDLLTRNFSDLTFIDKKDLRPQGNAKVHLVISDTVYQKKDFETQFGLFASYIHLVTKPLKRSELEARFTLETVRIEKPLDKAILVKIIKQLFPLLKELNPSPPAAITFDEQILLSTMMELVEYSEAALGFKQPVPIALDTILDIALTQDDEMIMKEMRAKVHYVDDTAKKEEGYYHQLVLFGMKDEFLKLIRLWTLQRHIQSNQGQ